ncbi:YesL family protein [Streptococcus ovis]|uniref:YesL family protein n=1 Tax=Streptococcus ovis TaxID=82806 RepID=UPI00037449EE|nr:YesL family protein [Streptococcus ovis]
MVEKMIKLFSIDSLLMRRLALLADLMILNILFILTSFPILTIGASITALNCSWQRIFRGETEKIVSSYFGYFKDNFYQATYMWFGLIISGIILILESIFFLGQVGLVRWLGLVVLLFLSVIWILISTVGLTYIGRYTGSLFQSMKNSLLLAFKCPFYCIFLIWLNAFVVYFALGSVVGMMTAIYAGTFGGFSLLAGINAWSVKHIFKKIEEN